MATIIQIMENTLASIDPTVSNAVKRIHLKEVVQSLVLDYIYNHKYYRGLNFFGGTCLHIIYDINRLSEDIDLDNSNEIDTSGFAADLENYFNRYLGYKEIVIKQQEGQPGILRYTLKFPLLYLLGLTQHTDEALHMKVEISQHLQVAQIKHTPVIHQGRSFVPAHFSIETMMAGKMLACLERSFFAGKTSVSIKGRDFYDLLWFMKKRVKPFEQKLEKDGVKSYNTQTAMIALQEKIDIIKRKDLETDLLHLFEQQAFIEAWIFSFHENFRELAKYYY